jgi:hypothetical protein
LVPCATAGVTMSTTVIAAAMILVGVMLRSVSENSEGLMPAWVGL